ncbi:2Fe-2S iron-sulfur cluster-binding protein [Streptomyces cuspidosporus]|uniref:2Fe-2S ferredoxin-type domain-containing protein n=1 Tax=Streptomyces cuspidosporus TaxID=66882 RepID=A0ABN3H0F9_9ACTN
MSDEQQPHRPDPGSGWQPMPHGPEYDAEATGFVQLPPDHSLQDPAALAGGWDPLAAPGTGYTPPPMTGVPGAPSQGGQWQPTAHDPGAHGQPTPPAGDPAGTGHWSLPMDAGADASGQWAQPGQGGDSGEYAYGGRQDPHAPHHAHDPHDPHGNGGWDLPAAGQGQAGQPGQAGQWSIPFAADDGYDETGAYPVNDPAAAAQWQVPEAPGGQWGAPAVGDHGVEESGEYPVVEHPGPAASPYGAHDTAQWAMPYADGTHEQQSGPDPHGHAQPHAQPHAQQGQVGQRGQTGQTGQWSFPVAGDDGAEDSGEYALGDHALRPAPAPQRLRGPARRRLRLPGGAHEVDDWPEELTHGGQGGADAHEGAGTPPHGVVPTGGRGGFVDDGYDEHGGYDGPADDGSAHEGSAHEDQGATPPHGVAAEGTPSEAPDALEAAGAAEAAEAFEAPEVPEALEPVEAAEAPEAHQAPEVHQAPAGPAQAGDSAELALDGQGAPLADADPSAGDGASADGGEPPAAEAAPEAAEPAAPADAPDAAAAADPAAPALAEATDATDATEATDAPADPQPDDADAALQVDGEHPSASYVLHVNGADRPVTDAWIGESLLYVLRERLGLAGAKDGCSQGECGACSVQVDGRLVASCLVPAATAAGCEVRTVEGLAVDGQPSDVQRALAACGAVQCGFCVPGLAMTVHDLLEGNHSPTDLETRQAICGNLCRCSGYRGVVDAVRQVVTEREAAAAADAEEAAQHDGQEAAARIPHQAGPPGINGAGGNGGFDGSGTGSGRATA